MNTKPHPALSRTDLVFLLLVSVLTVGLYLPGFTGPFVYDDVKQIEQNAALHNLADLNGVIHSGKRQSRLIQNMVFAVDWWLTPGRTLAFKLTNLLCHLTVGLLVFLFLRLIFDPQGFVVYTATALFFLHPLQIQSVTYVMGLTSLLISAVFVLALWLAAKQPGPRWLPFVPVILVGILVKELIVLLPAVLFLYWLLIKNIPFSRLLRSRSVWIIAASASLYFPYLTLMQDPLGVYERTVGWDLIPYGHYLLGQFRNYALYLWLIVFPGDQSLLHPVPPVTFKLIAAAVVGAIIYFGGLVWVYRNRQTRPAAAFFALFFYLTLLPTNGPIQMINPFAEYRLYLSNLCVFLLLAYLMQRAMAHLLSPRAVMAATLAILAYFSGFTFHHTQVWGNGYEVYRQAGREYPADFEAVYMAGTSYEKIGDYENALPLYTQSVELIEQSPRKTAKPMHRLAFTQFQLGRLRDSLETLNRIRAIDLLYAVPKSYFDLRLEVTARLNDVRDFEETLAEGRKIHGEHAFPESAALRARIDQTGLGK